MFKLSAHPHDRIQERSNLSPDVVDRAQSLLAQLPHDGQEKYHWSLKQDGALKGYLLVKRVGEEGRPVVSTFIGPEMKTHNKGPDLYHRLGDPLVKAAELRTTLLPHQQRVVDRIQKEDQPGLVVVHGLGSGKTLTSIAAQDALKKPATVVVPAALQENYRKEQQKHLKGKPQHTDIETLQRVARRGTPTPNEMLIVDEAHRARDPSSASYRALETNEADKRILLTGSPFYNHPSDIAPLINLAAGKEVLPPGKDAFSDRYISIKKESPGLWNKYVRGAQDSETPILNQAKAKELSATFQKWVDHHPGSKDNFPDVRREDVIVPMGDQQKKVYDTLMGQAPAWVAAKVRKGLPPSKQEAASLTAFLTGPRQVANSTVGFDEKGAPQSPKIQKAFENLQGMLKDNPEGRAVVYSNYLEAGIDPYKRLLQGAGVPHGEFTGSQTAKERDQMVRDYNEGRLRALLLSSAGGEGLDLKGTRMVQILEPHWNEEKLKQVEGRAARFKSHESLPEDQRNVIIQRYLAGTPVTTGAKIKQKLFGTQPDQTVDQYLTMMSKNKEDLNQQFRGLLPTHKTAAAHHDFLNGVEADARKRGYRMFAVVEDPAANDGASFTLGASKGNAVHNARTAHVRWEKKNGIDPHHDRRSDGDPMLKVGQATPPSDLEEPLQKLALPRWQKIMRQGGDVADEVRSRLIGKHTYNVDDAERIIAARGGALTKLKDPSPALGIPDISGAHPDVLDPQLQGTSHLRLGRLRDPDRRDSSRTVTEQLESGINQLRNADPEDITSADIAALHMNPNLVRTHLDAAAEAGGHLPLQDAIEIGHNPGLQLEKIMDPAAGQNIEAAIRKPLRDVRASMRETFTPFVERHRRHAFEERRDALVAGKPMPPTLLERTGPLDVGQSTWNYKGDTDQARLGAQAAAHPVNELKMPASQVAALRKGEDVPMASPWYDSKGETPQQLSFGAVPPRAEDVGYTGMSNRADAALKAQMEEVQNRPRWQPDPQNHLFYAPHDGGDIEYFSPLYTGKPGAEGAPSSWKAPASAGASPVAASPAPSADAPPLREGGSSNGSSGGGIGPGHLLGGLAGLAGVGAVAHHLRKKSKHKEEEKTAAKLSHFAGLRVRIDRPKGYVQKGKDKEGKPWERVYKVDYGFLPGTQGGDGDGLDVFLGPDEKADPAYLVYQKKDDGSFDEFKLMLGFKDGPSARACYVDHIPSKFLGKMESLSLNVVRALTGQPLDEEAIVKKAFLEELSRLGEDKIASEKLAISLKRVVLPKTPAFMQPSGLLGKYVKPSVLQDNPAIAAAHGIAPGKGGMFLAHPDDVKRMFQGKPVHPDLPEVVGKSVERHELTHYLRDKAGKMEGVGQPGLRNVLRSAREEGIAHLEGLKPFEAAAKKDPQLQRHFVEANMGVVPGVVDSVRDAYAAQGGPLRAAMSGTLKPLLPLAERLGVVQKLPQPV